MSGKKPIIGLCGGIGAGKSRVAAEMAALGCEVIDSDRQNHEVLRRPDVLATLRSWWGEQVLDAGGGPNRERIGEIVFSSPAERQRLEGLVHPLIARLREAMIKAANEDQATRAIILDSPLLFESNLDCLCDSIIFIDASPVQRLQRLQRLQQSRHWSEEQVRQREQWQMPLAEKHSRAEFVIDNDGPPERLRPQAMEILNRIVSRHVPGQ
jgi:dephospho-CoA kinase